MTTFSTIAPRLAEQAIELPSWAFGNSGTRFKVFTQPGVPRDPFEKVADAAQVHKHTGLAPTVSLHIPWDLVDSYADLAKMAVPDSYCSGKPAAKRDCARSALAVSTGQRPGNRLVKIGRRQWRRPTASA